MIITSSDFMFLLWRSRHIYDRRAEEILQCNEKAGIQKTSKTYTKTRGKIIYTHQTNSYLQRVFIDIGTAEIWQLKIFSNWGISQQKGKTEVKQTKKILFHLQLFYT